jgi:predicted component of type VI protein secretion system
MAKLTISFKGLLISTHHLGEEPITIGRNLDCEVVIDSLAVGPHHALISVHPDGYSIAAVDPDHPILLNNERIKQAPLHDGDLIQIGKHTLRFSEAVQDAAAIPAPAQKATPIASEADHLSSLPDMAYVQFQNGPQIGRILAVREDGARLTGTRSRSWADQAIITRRGDGYVLTCDSLAGETDIIVNGSPVPSGAEVPLPHAALIEIGDLRCRFFRRDA